MINVHRLIQIEYKEITVSKIMIDHREDNIIVYGGVYKTGIKVLISRSVDTV